MRENMSLSLIPHLSKRILSLLLIISLIACAEPQKMRQLHGHQTPAQPPLPDYPVGTFDEKISQEKLLLAKSHRLSGDDLDAKNIILDSIEKWPISVPAWLELRDVCEKTKDETCLAYASFFLSKVSFAETLPARAASLGFETIASGTIGQKAGGYLYDEKGLAMARKLWAFYGADDPIKGGDAVPRDEETFFERYPYLSMAAIVGTGTYLVIFIKNAANK